MNAPDPRTMLLMAACFSTKGVLIEETALLFGVFVLAVTTSLLFKANLFVLLKRLRGFLIVMAMVALMESVFNRQGEVLLRIGTLPVMTTAGVLRGINIMLRIGIITASAAIFTRTTSRHMIQGLVQLKVPYEFAFMASVALRFLPVFTEEFKDTVTAVQLRGVNLKKIPLKKKLKMYGMMLTPVTYGAIERAKKLSYAMELRAFRAFPHRTSRLTLSLRALDYAIIVIMPLVTVAVLLFYYGYML